MNPRYIIVHHSLTKDSETVSWGAIRNYHRSLGYIDIGYHWGIERVGDWYEIIVGRTMAQDGAHCVTMNMNRVGIGICCVGNFDVAPMPKEQEDVLARLVLWLLDELSVPIANVLGHREVGAKVGYDWRLGEYKSCPGKLFDMTAFRKRLREEKNGQAA